MSQKSPRIKLIALLTLGLGIFLPYVVNPAIYHIGGFKGYAFLQIFNLIPILVLLIYLWFSRILFFITSVLAFIALAWQYWQVNLYNDPQASVKLVFIPIFVALGIVMLGAILGIIYKIYQLWQLRKSKGKEIQE